MTRRQPFGPDETDLDGLVADAIAMGMQVVKPRLRPLTATRLRELIEAEVELRQRVLLQEARGQVDRAHSLLIEEYRRWHR
jgi:hypothetical protein